jgi:hypothetical protein
LRLATRHRDVIAERGRIVAEFFDVGCSRRLPWARRPQAARLLAALADPHRGFDAIIVGESERAFTGTQLLHLAPIFLAHGVQVWLPELDGPVCLTDPAHQALILALRERARREVARARYRTTAALREAAIPAIVKRRESYICSASSTRSAVTGQRREGLRPTHRHPER